MFMQKLKVSLRFLGILFLRVLLGIVIAYVWLFAVPYGFHVVMDVRIPPDIFDHFYDTGPPLEERYGGSAAEFYGAARQVAILGAFTIFYVGMIWGFLQGRLDIRKWLKKRHA